MKKSSTSWIPIQKTTLLLNLSSVKSKQTGDYRYNYAHENNTLSEKSHLLCTKADLITIQGKGEKFDIVEQCTQQIQKTKWRFKLITDVTSLAALLKNIPMGCSDSVLPEPLLKNHSVNFVLSDKYKQPCKDQLCLSCALTIYLHGHSNLDAHTSHFLKSLYQNPDTIRSIDELPPVEGIVELSKLLYDFDNQEGEYVGELARRSIRKFDFLNLPIL